MDPINFLLFAFATACIVGPLVGVLGLLLVVLLSRVNREGFSVTIGMPPHEKSGEDKYGRDW